MWEMLWRDEKIVVEDTLTKRDRGRLKDAGVDHSLDETVVAGDKVRWRTIRDVVWEPALAASVDLGRKTTQHELAGERVCESGRRRRSVCD